MRTQAQIEASRANGAKSKGPVTEEGKNRASRNATRHGLLAETVVLKGESIERFHDHLAGFIAEFKPESSLELELVEKMAVFRWRQLSVWGLETASITDAITELTENSPEVLDKDPAVRASLAIAEIGAKSKILDLFQRYDTRFDRQFDRALKQLTASRREKKSNSRNEPNF